MEYIQERFGRGIEEVNVLYLGDTHTGHPNYREDIVDNALDELMSRPNPRIIIMGDLTEMALTSSVGNTYEQLMTPEEQMDYWVEKLKPYRDIIVAGVGSNHNERAVREVGMNPARLIFKMLGIKEKFNKYSVLVKWSFNKGCLHNYIHHGSTGARTDGGILNKMKKMNNTVEADIYSMGHTHRLITSDESIRKYPDSRNMKINTKRYYYINTGSALDWDEGYAEMKGYPPVLLGFPIARLTGKKGNQKVDIDKISLKY